MSVVTTVRNLVDDDDLSATYARAGGKRGGEQADCAQMMDEKPHFEEWRSPRTAVFD